MNKPHLATPYVVWIIGFTVLPLLFVLYYGLTDASGNFTLANIAAIADPIHLKALWLSLLLAFIATTVCLIIAYPLAMIMRKLNLSKGSFIVMLLILPMWMNHLLKTLAWQLLLSNNGIFNTIFMALGMEPVQMLNTSGAIVLGMIYDFLPFMILPIFNALTRIDKDVIDAARDLGANPLTVFRRIILPLSMPGIISGITMVFVPSMTSFVISDILGGGKILLIGNVIEQEFNKTFNWHLGSGISIILMIFVIASMSLMSRRGDKEGGAALW